MVACSSYLSNTVPSKSISWKQKSRCFILGVKCPQDIIVLAQHRKNNPCPLPSFSKLNMNTGVFIEQKTAADFAPVPYTRQAKVIFKLQN